MRDEDLTERAAKRLHWSARALAAAAVDLRAADAQTAHRLECAAEDLAALARDVARGRSAA